MRCRRPVCGADQRPVAGLQAVTGAAVSDADWSRPRTWSVRDDRRAEAVAGAAIGEVAEGRNQWLCG